MIKQVDEGLSGRNNVEIESKLPCEKSVEEQIGSNGRIYKSS